MSISAANLKTADREEEWQKISTSFPTHGNLLLPALGWD
jgi:hypothetical protein